MMLAPELTRIFLGKDFQSAVDYVIWGALAEAARVLIGAYSLIAHVYMRTRWLIWPNLIGAVLSIAFCTLLIPHLGADGAGAGLVLSGYAMVATMHVLLVKRVGGSGAPLRPIIMAGIFAITLWGLTLVLRDILNPAGWGMIAGVLVLTGICYLVLQYIFLREHLEDKGNKTHE
jgi:O-antigen/teichoic acid export membrane protein